MASTTRRSLSILTVFPDTEMIYFANSWSQAILEGSQLEAVLQCVVDSVVYCKHVDVGWEHEFLMIHVSHEPTQTKTIIGTDRDVKNDGRRNPGKSSPAASQTSVESSAGASATFSTSSVNAVPADDRIVVGGLRPQDDFDRRFGAYTPLSTLTFSTRPTVLQLAVLLEVVHNHAPAYQIVKFQCFWYCLTIVNSLRDIFEGTQSDPDKIKNVVKRWKDIPVPAENSLTAVREAYDEAWPKAQAKIDARREEVRAREATLIKQGIAQGVERGIEQGVERGIEQGRQQARAQVERAEMELKAMKEENARLMAIVAQQAASPSA